MKYKGLVIILVIIFISCTTYNTNYSEIKKIKVACVGDSITYGSGIKNKNFNSYPAKLQAKLGDKYHVENFGVNGATLLKDGNKPYWKTKAFSNALDFNPDILIIKLGTNDTKIKNWKYQESFVKHYTMLIDAFTGINSAVNIYLCYPTPSFPGIWGIRNSKISDIISMMNEIDREFKIIDLNTPLQSREELFPDSVHPDENGAEAISEIVFEAVSKDIY